MTFCVATGKLKLVEQKNGPVCYVNPKSPPSSYAVAAVLEGEPFAVARVVGATAVRSAFIVPGLALAGVRGRHLLWGAVLGATGITAALFALYGLRRARVMNDPYAGLGGLL